MGALLDLVFPHRCPACDGLAGGVPGFCERCRISLVPVPDPLCPRCGAPLGGDGPALSCAACRSNAPAFTAARSAFLFGGPLGEAIARFKAGRIPEFPSIVAPAVKDAAIRLIRATPSLPCFDMALPVPPDPARLARRGFDPGSLVAAATARALGLRLRHDLLSSSIRPRPQRSLPRDDRRVALAGAFRITERGRRILPGMHVLLLDDVRTTGSTVEECSTEILRSGAASVRVATLALVE